MKKPSSGTYHHQNPFVLRTLIDQELLSKQKKRSHSQGRDATSSTDAKGKQSRSTSAKAESLIEKQSDNHQDPKKIKINIPEGKLKLIKSIFLLHTDLKVIIQLKISHLM
jgi:hypothetical protein